MTHTEEWRRSWKFPYIKEGEPTKWGWVVLHTPGLKLGNYVDIGYGCLLQAEAGLTIDDDVELGAHVAVYTVSTIDDKRGPVILRKGCKIGAGSVVLPNVTVGEGTIVGALSLVNKDLPDHVVAYGIPARAVKMSGGHPL